MIGWEVFQAGYHNPDPFLVAASVLLIVTVLVLAWIKGR